MRTKSSLTTHVCALACPTRPTAAANAAPHTRKGRIDEPNVRHRQLFSRFPGQERRPLSATASCWCTTSRPRRRLPCAKTPRTEGGAAASNSSGQQRNTVGWDHGHERCSASLRDRTWHQTHHSLITRNSMHQSRGSLVVLLVQYMVLASIPVCR